MPDAVPALDCPVIFNFAPTAVMLGFLSCLATVILCVVLFGAMGLYALTPPVITCFFGGGPAGVFGNSTGGWRGAVLAGITAGLMLSIGQALTVGCLSTTIADFARWSNGLGVCKIIQQRKLLEIQVESLYWEKHISINKRIWYNWRCAGRRLSWNASLMKIRKLGKDMLCIRF